MEEGGGVEGGEGRVVEDDVEEGEAGSGGRSGAGGDARGTEWSSPCINSSNDDRDRSRRTPNPSIRGCFVVLV